jgi:hypothetical protein
MLRTIRNAVLATFVVLVFAAIQQGVLASAGSDDAVCTCYAIGVDCFDRSNSCGDVTDAFCTNVCAGLESSCGESWGEGFEAGCSACTQGDPPEQGICYSCACTLASLP